MSKEKLKVVKIGGYVVDSPAMLESVLRDFAALDGKKLLVHGGGRLATKVSSGLGIETQMVQGRRVTDAQTLQVVTMVYAGWINKSITAQLHSLGLMAWGVCGADAMIMPARKRAIQDGVDYGFVGDVDSGDVNSGALSGMLNGGYSVVVAPITMTRGGQLLNTNADTVAQNIAVALSEEYDVELIYFFERSGVLSDIDDEASLIPLINHTNYCDLKSQGKIFDGMIPKIDNALFAVQSGVSVVRICNNLNQRTGTIII